MAEIPSRQEYIEAVHGNWNINHGVDNEIMRDIGYDTPYSLPDTISRVTALAGQAVGPIPHVNQIGRSAEPAEISESSTRSHLESVTPEQEPLPGIKREVKLRAPRRPRTPRELLAADQPPESQRVTPHGHDYDHRAIRSS